MHVDSVSSLFVEEPSTPLRAEIQRFKDIPYDPLVRGSSKGSLAKYSLLSITDNFSYTGREFEYQKVCTPKVVECMFEGETCSFEVFSYKRAFMSSIKQGVSPPSITDESLAPELLEMSSQMDNRINYKNVSPRSK